MDLTPPTQKQASNAEQSARILAHLPAVKIPSVVRSV